MASRSLCPIMGKLTNLVLKEEMNAENLLNVLKEESVADENYIQYDVVRKTWHYYKIDDNTMADK